MGPGQGFPTIPEGHHAQATPKAALNDYLTIQSPTGVRLVPGGWQETSARFGHHAFAHMSGTRVDRLVTVVPAEGGGWWVQDVSAC